MVAPLYTTDSGLLFHAGKILVVTIGLPARGKTHISRSLERYLRWMGVKTQVVSLGDYRRKTLGGAQKLPADYFHLGEKSPETIALRKKVSDGCEQQIWDFFKTGQVVIYDANNGTREARQKLAERFHKKGIHVIMLESVCDNKEIIEANIRSVKISSPDYRGWDSDKAVQDYYTRIRDHEEYYDPVEEKDWPYIRIFNVGERIMVNNIKGYLQSRIVFFLMNIHNTPRTIYFARSGQSLIEHSYKADSDLSPPGWEYAERLKDFVLERRAKNLAGRGVEMGGKGDSGLMIWTSTRRRAHHTAWPFLQAAAASTSSMVTPAGSHLPTPGNATPINLNPSSISTLTSLTINTSVPHLTEAPMLYSKPRIKVIEKPQMSEINPGIWDGLTPDQARKYYPQDWERFVRDPYAFRAPRAESYHDLSVRLEPTLIELEREKQDLLIIGHASVIRCLLAYLIGLPASEIPAIEVARGDLLEVTPASYGVHCRAYHFWDGPGRVRDEGDFGKNKHEGVVGGEGIGSGEGKGDGEKAQAVVESMGGRGVVSEERTKGEGLMGLGGMMGGISLSTLPVEQQDSDSSSAGISRLGVDMGVGGIGEQKDANNFYENYAEDTKGKRKVDSFFAGNNLGRMEVPGSGVMRTREPEAGLSELLS
ncbi:bifunctional 6-phosphofructo-2-kinase/fructose-2,6-bisphosphate 2-phosphatase [Lentinula boryana]|uniref:Bifunctional 6-phosphofructo-2-kinase/fructose-2,6-bisphosphate 2-phosphatase n=1 Tax=Lentinula boryana TaxID=40481 RepID=A0ABQ8Q709_9AGAR|nr:bifunctional 6-phosphofructo-2-kinase/fructose-2,6-bisphosphate 2-phosphatase [Lentinula boryana]